MMQAKSREAVVARRAGAPSFVARRGERALSIRASAPLVTALIAGSLVCCGGSRKSAASADGETTANTPGQKCLADADAHYEPRPDAPPRIDVEHILVRHAGLEDPHGATRSPEEACLRALEAWKKLQAGAEWDAIVAEYSDSRGAAAGKLSRVSTDELDPDFARVAFSLEPDQLSYVVRTGRGFHLILRTH